MHPVAAAFWGGFFTVAAVMLAAAMVAAARGFSRVAAAGATYSVVPVLFVCAFLKLLPIDEPDAQSRFLTHLTVLGSMGLTSQLLLVLRGYRKPLSNQPLQLALLVSAVAMLVLCWLVPPRWGMWLANGYGLALGFGLIVLALRKAVRGTRVAWISAAGVSLAIISLVTLDWIWVHGDTTPLAVHALGALSSMAYIGIMGWAMWMRYAYALELKQVLAQGPSFDPVTRLLGSYTGGAFTDEGGLPLVNPTPLVMQVSPYDAINHTLLLNWTTMPGHGYTPEYSYDLVNWYPIRNQPAIATGNVDGILMIQLQPFTRAYYRVRSY